MQRPFLYFLLAIFLVSCNRPVKGTNGVTYKNPAEYNDYIVSRQSTLVRAMLEFDKLSKDDLDAAVNLLNRNAQDAELIIIEVKGMPPYKGDSSLRDAAVNLFSFYKRLYSVTYPQMIAIRKKGEAITDEDIAEIVRLSDKVTSEEEGLDKTLLEAQELFAQRNNMKLQENAIQRKVDKKGNGE